MKFTLEIITTLDPVAVYAAIVATVVLIWDVVKWIRSGPVLKLECMPGRKIVGGGQSNRFSDKTITHIKVSNRGSKATTLNNVAVIWYKNFWDRIRNKPAMQGLIPDPKLTQDFPYELAPGSEWSGAIDEGSLDKKIKESGIAICQLFHSFSDKPVQTRILFQSTHEGED